MRLRDASGKRVPYNECVDWFSLGCILYEFLRGMSPFRTERAIEWCADTIQDKVKAPIFLRPTWGDTKTYYVLTVVNFVRTPPREIKRIVVVAISHDACFSYV